MVLTKVFATNREEQVGEHSEMRGLMLNLFMHGK